MCACAKPFSVSFTGSLVAYAASADGPAFWALHEDGRPGPEGVHALLNGDFLTVYGEDGGILWSGIVDLDFEAGLVSDLLRPGQSWQEAGGHRVHGLQRGERVEAWASMFFEGRRAVLQR